MIIDCKRIADSIRLEAKPRVLGVIRYGESEDTEMFCKSIMRETEKYDISVVEVDIEGQNLEGVVNTLVKACNKIVCCNPFPKEIKEQLQDIIPSKMDIDNFTGKSKYKNCTAEAVRMVLEKVEQDIEGVDVCILGQNVGWEIAREIKDMMATPIVCNSKTDDRGEKTYFSPIVISAMGVKNGLLNKDISNHSTVIDVGNDAEPRLLERELINITPQRNGIGLITTKILLKKVLEG